jgi:hypothetical protein
MTKFFLTHDTKLGAEQKGTFKVKKKTVLTVAVTSRGKCTFFLKAPTNSIGKWRMGP